MSRSDSNSPQSSPTLSRRAVLPGIVAVPTALAGATGQAFSQNSSVSADRRFAKVDRMIRKINDTCVAQSEASDREGERNEDGDDVYEVASDKWFAAQDALVQYADKVASNPSPTVADALVLAKIGDFQIVNQGADVDILDQERSV